MGSASYNRGSQSIRKQIDQENKTKELPRQAELEIFYKNKSEQLQIMLAQKDSCIVDLQQDKVNQQCKIEELENKLKNKIEKNQSLLEDKAELKRRWLLLCAILRYVLCFSPEKIQELKLDAYELFPHLKR